MSKLAPVAGYIDPDFDTESAASLAPENHANDVRDLALLSGHLARRIMVDEERYYWDGELPGFGCEFQLKPAMDSDGKPATIPG